MDTISSVGVRSAWAERVAESVKLEGITEDDTFALATGTARVRGAISLPLTVQYRVGESSIYQGNGPRAGGIAEVKGVRQAGVPNKH